MGTIDGHGWDGWPTKIHYLWRLQAVPLDSKPVEASFLRIHCTFNSLRWLPPDLAIFMTTMMTQPIILPLMHAHGLILWHCAYMCYMTCRICWYCIVLCQKTLRSFLFLTEYSLQISSTKQYDFFTKTFMAILLSGRLRSNTRHSLAGSYWEFSF